MPTDKPHIIRSGVLTNFAPSPFRGQGPDGRAIKYLTVEHYFQAHKTVDQAEHARIAAARTPQLAKLLGRKTNLREDWEEVKEKVMLDGLRLKFAQPPFRAKLLGTGERPIIEESKHDLEWGARKDGDGWDGENRLGKLLQQVREEIRCQESESEPQMRLIP